MRLSIRIRHAVFGHSWQRYFYEEKDFMGLKSRVVRFVCPCGLRKQETEWDGKKYSTIA